MSVAALVANSGIGHDSSATSSCTNEVEPFVGLVAVVAILSGSGVPLVLKALVVVAAVGVALPLPWRGTETRTKTTPNEAKKDVASGLPGVD